MFFQDSGSTEFSKHTLESLNHFCFDQIKKYEIYYVRKGTKRASVVDAIGKLICPNDCSSHGVCNEGIWILSKILRNLKVSTQMEIHTVLLNSSWWEKNLYGNLLNMKCFTIIIKAMWSW